MNKLDRALITVMIIGTAIIAAVAVMEKIG
jgi:hypothetical protein